MIRLALYACLIVALASCDDGEREASGNDQRIGTVQKPDYEIAPALDSSAQPLPELTAPDRTWTYSSTERSATYKGSETEGVISLRCDETPLGNLKLVFNWMIRTSPDQNQTVSMRWGNDTETFAVEPVGRAQAAVVSNWRAIFNPTGEEANFLLIATSPITFRFGALGEPNVTLPASDTLKRAVQSCQ